MPLNISAATKVSHERLSLVSHKPNNGLMDSSEKHKLKAALGLPSKMKTFGIETIDIRDLYIEADYFIRDQLKSLGLFISKPLGQEPENFRKNAPVTISLGPLYGQNKIYIEQAEEDKVKTSFTLKVDGEPTVFSSISREKTKNINFYSLTYVAKAINSLPKEYLKELMNRKKGLIIQTGQRNEKNIPSNNCLLFELEVKDDNGIEIIYRELSNKADDAGQTFQNHTLAAIIHI